MEKAAMYGGEGMKIRTEYMPLSRERKLGLFLDVSEALETAFDRAHQIGGLTGSVEVGPEMSVREVQMESHGIDTDCSEGIFADAETGDTLWWRQPMKRSVEKTVLVRHEAYRHGPKEEEYILSVHRTIPGVLNSFYAVYTVEYFRGGGVQAMVAMNNIPVDADESASQERQMTEYDVSEFEKEVNEAVWYMDNAYAEDVQAKAYRSLIE